VKKKSIGRLADFPEGFGGLWDYEIMTPVVRANEWNPNPVSKTRNSGAEISKNEQNSGKRRNSPSPGNSRQRGPLPSDSSITVRAFEVGSFAVDRYIQCAYNFRLSAIPTGKHVHQHCPFPFSFWSQMGLRKTETRQTAAGGSQAN
jgi:hypothetical protein